MAGCGRPRPRSCMERRLWLAVARPRSTSGSTSRRRPRRLPAVIDQVDLASIAERERVTKHDVKARIEEFNALAGHEYVHIGHDLARPHRERRAAAGAGRAGDRPRQAAWPPSTASSRAGRRVLGHGADRPLAQRARRRRPPSASASRRRPTSCWSPSTRLEDLHRALPAARHQGPGRHRPGHARPARRRRGAARRASRPRSPRTSASRRCSTASARSTRARSTSTWSRRWRRSPPRRRAWPPRSG